MMLDRSWEKGTRWGRGKAASFEEWVARKFRSSTQDVPFELVGEIASACAVTEASDIEGGSAAARHGGADGWSCCPERVEMKCSRGKEQVAD